jgi:spermidine synthase
MKNASESDYKSTNLFLASFVALFFELLVIRYLATEIRVFAYLKNLPLLASFLGIGVGMIYGRREKVERLFPWAVLILFALIRFAPLLHLTHIGFPDPSYFAYGDQGQKYFESLLNATKHVWIAVYLMLALYLIVSTAILLLVTGMFATLGGLVGEYLKTFEPLRGYGINLLGSLAGILIFTLLAFLSTPPVVWLLLGSLFLVPFFRRKPLVLAVLLCIVLMHTIPEKNTFWSPYQRIDFEALPPLAGSSQTSEYYLSVNHDYHQKILNLSQDFMAKHPEAEPYHTAFTTYELPYFLVPKPTNVLVVGAGTGNDVAAAIRHGAQHVDAVEIDPVILQLGRKYHPERPYDSPLVTVHIDDARAFFAKATIRYDLIVFAYLDSHTLFSSFSSLRLDNYVYTVESFEAARRLLTADGTVVVTIFSGKPFVQQRIFSMLEAAFGSAPVALARNVFIEGATMNAARKLPFMDISDSLRQTNPILATDSWPFLYLDHRSIPISLLMLLAIIALGAYILLNSALGTDWTTNNEYRQMFFLGAAFMLLETKGITQLSLLFGSTWIVNAVVIGAFLTMGFLANVLVTVKAVSLRLTYALLLITLVLAFVISPARFVASPTALKVIAASLLVGLPVFFSGIVFSSSFRVVSHPEKALAVNLFGAVAGGILENAVMLGGINTLGVLAILLYASALTCLVAKTPKSRLTEAVGR